MDRIKNQEELNYRKKLIELAERQIRESKDKLEGGYLTEEERSRLIEINRHLEKELFNSTKECEKVYGSYTQDYKKVLADTNKELEELYKSFMQKRQPYSPEPFEEGNVRKLLTQAYSPSNHKRAVAEKANALFEKLYEAGADGAEAKQIEERIRKFAEKMNYDAEFGLDKKTLEERIKYKI